MKDSKILIVEDEALVATDLSMALKKNGYNVVGTAVTGKETIDSIEKYKPDIIIMDIVLPGDLDGIETAEIIHKKYKVPIIFCTSLNDFETIERSKKTDPFGYIVKPFEERNLVTTIEVALVRGLYEKKEFENRSFLSSMLLGLSEGFIGIDSEMRVILFNPVSSELTGVKEENAIGKLLSDVFVPAGDNEELNPAIMALLSKNYIPQKESMLRNLKTGREFSISSNAFPVFDSDGNVKGAAIVFRDITQEKQLESEKSRSAKLDAMSLLAGGIAHDFNNLLTVILGNSSIARSSEGVEGTEISVLLEEIEKAAFRARNLTQQLLTFSKGGTPVKKIASMADLLNEAVSFLLSGTKVKPNFKIARDLKFTEIDEGQIYQVLQNLVINAVQAMPGGGFLSVEASNYQITKQESHSLKPGEYIKITVSDTGSGIPKEIINSIFDPYFTTKETGSGLGLAISYSIIKKHAGAIEVDSVPSCGTTFTIYLPVAGTHVTVTSETETKFSGEGWVIVVDDQDAILEMSRLIIKQIGMIPAVYNNSQMALKKMEEIVMLNEPIFCVILDLIIPGDMSGTDILREMKKIYPNVRAIISSGFSTNPIVTEYKKHGFSSLLLKPYTKNDFCKALNQLT